MEADVTDGAGRPIVATHETMEKIVGEPLPRELAEIVPWGHRLVVVREKPIEESPGGIAIPKTAQKELSTGWVVAVGDRVGEADGYSATYPGMYPFARETLIGTKVTFGRYAGHEIMPKADTIGGVRYGSRFLVLSEGDVLFHHHSGAAATGGEE